MHCSLPMQLTVKNMVCPRCISAVEAIISSLQLTDASVILGQITLPRALTAAEKITLAHQLSLQGFELIDDHKSQLIEQIKTIVITEIHHKPGPLQQNWPALLAQQIAHDYKYISQLFSSVMGITLEQYIIRQKTEKAKELIIYDQLSVKEIAYLLGYSSTAHLGNQFKQVTGMTPGQFKKQGSLHRKPIDSW